MENMISEIRELGLELLVIVQIQDECDIYDIFDIGSDWDLIIFIW